MSIRNQHGGDIYKACLKYGLKREEILDFSANINPLGIPPGLKNLILSNIEDLTDYPDPECNELREELAEYLGTGKESIIAGNGASEIIYLLFDVLRPREVLMPAPCFAEYAGAAAAFGSQIRYYELMEKQDFRLNVDDFLCAADGGIDTILLCNPNNPTSALIPREELLKILEYADGRGINVIIDEAFIELTEGGSRNSAVQYLKNFRGLCIIRALTKLMAVPGLRLGYAAGNREIIGKMLERKLPWSVNTFACGVGRILNLEREYLEKTEVWLSEEKKHLYEGLSRLPKLKVYRPDTNFILIRLLDDRLKASALKGLLMQEGILIRDASNFKYLDDSYVRVAVKDKRSNEILIGALQTALTQTL